MQRGDGRSAVERLWFGRGIGARVARAALTPASALFALGAAARNAMYDTGVLASRRLAIPAVSVGNLSVGGTGKTPVAAWIVGELARRGARPAVVLRGYGADEPIVHDRLNPGAIVIIDPDRVSGVARAAGEGADVAVLDDAFQHRRARRDADIVLVSADRWTGTVRLLPAGPFREGLRALERATLVIVTRKAASAADAAAVTSALRGTGDRQVAQVHLSAASLVDVHTGRAVPLSTLAGRPVLAICGVGDPGAFGAQLEAAGAQVDLRSFPDHFSYPEPAVGGLLRDAVAVCAAGGAVVCTLKDAVKLSSRWPSGEAALSFVSQQVIVESGQEPLDRLLDSVLRARNPAAAAPG